MGNWSGDYAGSMETHAHIGDAVDAVQAELGTDPAGSYDTVVLRLATLLEVPTEPTSITGTRGTGDSDILAALLTALDSLGLISDDTTGA